MKEISTDVTKSERYENMKDWMRMKGMMYLLTEEFDMLEYFASGIILDAFTLHSSQKKEVIIDYFKRYWYDTLLYSTVFENRNSIILVNQVARYYGTNVGFYLAFNVIMEVSLIPLSFISMALFVNSIFYGVSHSAVLFYNAILSVWPVYLSQKFLGSQGQMDFLWDMEHVDFHHTPRAEYRGEYMIDPKNNEIKKRDPVPKLLRGVLVGFPLYLLGAAMIFTVFILSVSLFFLIS